MKLRVSVQSFFILSMALLFSCKTPKNNNESNGTESKSAAAADSMIVSDNLSSRLKVAFMSSGRGIDRKAKERYDEYIQKFEADNNSKLKIEILRAGKEGEMNYCFDLANLDSKKQDEFIAGTKELLKTAELVHVYENVVCH